MKRLTTLLLAIVLLISLGGCKQTATSEGENTLITKGEKTATTESSVPDTLSNELLSAYKEGLCDSEMLWRLTDSITEKELCRLLGQAIKFVNGAETVEWNKRITNAGNSLIERQHAASIIRDAAGIGLGINEPLGYPRHYIDDHWFMDELDPKYGELNADSSALEFVCGVYNVEGSRLMECTAEGYFRFGDKMTIEEAILAAYRLTNSITVLTDVQNQEARYTPIGEVGSYNTNIITDELLNKETTLPDATNQFLPYWTGYNLENKIFAREEYRYFYEDEIKFLSDNGFNCARILYSFTFLSNPEDPTLINEAELEQLDELISWGMKYNVNIQISNIGIPGAKGEHGDFNSSRENVGGLGGTSICALSCLLSPMCRKQTRICVPRFACQSWKQSGQKILIE